MKAILFSLIGISILQSVLLIIVNDEQLGKMIQLIGGVAVASVLFTGISEFDYASYAASIQRQREEIRWDEASVKEDVNALHRRYIESKCAAYILENASNLQIDLTDVNVDLAWNTEGYWYPVRTEITASGSAGDLTRLKSIIESELGIPIEEQIWRMNDE